MENQTEQQSSAAEPKTEAAEPKTKLSDNDKLFAGLSYLGILCLVPLLLKKNNEYVQFHARQGLVLAMAEVAAWFLNIIPFLGPMIWMLFSLVFVIISIAGIVKAAEGEKWEIPVVHGYAKRIQI